MVRFWGLIFILWLLWPAYSFGSSTLNRVYNQVVTLVAAPVNADYLKSSEVPKQVASGVFVSRNGLILAPAYLVQGARWVDVILPNGTFLGGKVLGVDHLSGLALLKVNYSYQNLGVSISRRRVQVGEDIFLVGRPRFKASLRAGKVIENPVSVSFSFGTLASFYATNLSLAGIGSGPVFNARGELVGFALDLPNLHFAGGLKIVPSHLIRPVVAALSEKGQMVWPWLGVEGLPLNPTLAKVLKLPFNQGLLVTKTLPGSPARKIGLLGQRKSISLGNIIYPVGGDIIVSVAGRRVGSQADLERIIFAKKPGDIVTIKYWRGKKFHNVKVYLGKRSFLQP
ncbi:S1C family serine protease [Thermodesulfatator indicus]